MHTEGFEFHLNMDEIKRVKFEMGESKRGNFTTYAIRFLDVEEKPALSLFLQWGKPGNMSLVRWKRGLLCVSSIVRCGNRCRWKVCNF
jgi:hypothetical protein